MIRQVRGIERVQGSGSGGVVVVAGNLPHDRRAILNSIGGDRNADAAEGHPLQGGGQRHESEACGRDLEAPQRFALALHVDARVAGTVPDGKIEDRASRYPHSLEGAATLCTRLFQRIAIHP